MPRFEAEGQEEAVNAFKRSLAGITHFPHFPHFSLGF